ncbi:MAG: ORF6N domain-containing protein [Ruminococcus sp.]|nr:ORF6N domain-containing protein [Ruminococcus sp.]
MIKMYEIINDVPLKIKEYKGQRVVTFKDIDTIHNRPEGTARKRFNDNRKHFIEGEDFFIVNQASEIRTLGITRPQGGTPSSVILVTESGYLMLVKSFTDDLSWNVQRQLVKTYFRVQEIKNADIEKIVNTTVEKAVSEIVRINFCQTSY